MGAHAWNTSLAASLMDTVPSRAIGRDRRHWPIVPPQEHGHTPVSYYCYSLTIVRQFSLGCTPIRRVTRLQRRIGDPLDAVCAQSASALLSQIPPAERIPTILTCSQISSSWIIPDCSRIPQTEEPSLLFATLHMLVQPTQKNSSPCLQCLMNHPTDWCVTRTTHIDFGHPWCEIYHTTVTIFPKRRSSLSVWPR